MIKLQIVWSGGDVRITADGRPWLIQGDAHRRLVWRIFSQLPCLRISKDWRSARWLAREYKDTNLHFQAERFLELPKGENEEVIPSDNPILNQLVLECMQSGYFLQNMDGKHRVNWFTFKAEAPMTQQKRMRMHVPVPIRETNVLDFMRNQTSRLASNY